MNSLTRAMTAMALAVCIDQAQATDHHVSATLTNVQIQVIDLRPGDGQAAGYTIQDTSHTVLESALNVEPAQPLLLERYESDRFIPHDTAVSDGVSFAKFSRRGPYGEIAAEARGYGYFVDTNFAQAIGADKLDLLVAPYTRLVFSGRYRLERTLADDAPTDLTSLAATRVDLEDRWGIEARFFESLQRTFGPVDEVQQVKEGAFSLEYNAYSEEALSVLFFAIGSVAAPIPEPANWGMLLAGLGILGLPRRGKSQGQRRKASFSV